MINFENIIVDTDFGGALSFRSMDMDRRANLSGDPDDIVVEMTQFDKDEEKNESNSKARLRSKINAKPSLSGSSAS